MDEESEVNDFCKDSEMRLRPTQLAQRAGGEQEDGRRRAGGGLLMWSSADCLLSRSVSS